MNFFLIKTKGFFNGRNCKQCFDETVFFLKSEVIVNRILIVSIVINKYVSQFKKFKNNNNNNNNNTDDDDDDDDDNNDDSDNDNN